MAVVYPEDAGPVWPRVGVAARSRWLVHELQVDYLRCAMSQRSSDTVCTRVSASNDHHFLALHDE